MSRGLSGDHTLRRMRELLSSLPRSGIIRIGGNRPDTTKCWQSAQVGQIRTREDYYYEELRGSSLRVLL